MRQLHVKLKKKLFQNYFGFCLTEVILCEHVEACLFLPIAYLKLFQNYFRGLLQFMNIYQHVQCDWNNFSTLYFSFRCGYM